MVSERRHTTQRQMWMPNLAVALEVNNLRLNQKLEEDGKKANGPPKYLVILFSKKTSCKKL